jgi:hypothetical protein
VSELTFLHPLINSLVILKIYILSGFRPFH